MTVINRLIGKRTVANDLMIWLVLTIIPTFFIIGIFSYIYTTQHLLTLLSQRAETTKDEIIQVVSPQLFYMDNKAVVYTAEVFLASGRLLGVKVISETDGIIIDIPPATKSLIQTKEQPIVYNGHILGKIQLWFDDQEIRDAQRQTIFIILSVLAATIAVIIFAIRFVLQSMLVKPLGLLKSKIEELASGSFEGTLPPVPQYNLNSIMSAVNNMATQLSNKTTLLEESEKKYREIFNATGDAVFIHDVSTGAILDVNSTMLKMYGYKHHEALKLSIGDVSAGTHHYTNDDAVHWIEKAVQKGPQIFEWLARHKNGEYFWVEIALQSTHIGGEGRVLSVVRDISSRKESEKELLREKAFNEAIINSLPGIFYVYDEDLRLIQWNNNFEIISGYSSSEMPNKYALDWFEEAEQPVISKALQELSEKGWASVEASLLIKNGTKMPFFLSASQVGIKDNKYIVGIGLDMTKQKKIAEELRQAQKMEAIGTLAGGIAHDFNNILGVISGYTELTMMKLKDESSKSKENLKAVIIAVNRAKGLVQQILTFSRKTEEHEQVPLQLSILLKESLKMLRPMIPASIEIKQQIDSQDIILADPTQIHQVIMNLCTNAYYAMLETGGTLGIKLRTERIEQKEYIPGMAPGTYLRLEVSDTGSGMSKEILSKIFEPYFTTKEKGKGTGLGLAVVHGIVKSHHGHITVYSEPGMGTTFNIYFPITEEDRDTYTVEIKEEELQGGSEHIMFVDDEEKIASLTSDMLEEYGYTVTTFGNGVQAFQELEKVPEKYDLVITDMTMPYMNGIDLAKKLMVIAPHLPIILCTGHSELVSREKALAMGIRDFCEKPIMLNELIRSIRHVLDEK